MTENNVEHQNAIAKINGMSWFGFFLMPLFALVNKMWGSVIISALVIMLAPQFLPVLAIVFLFYGNRWAYKKVGGSPEKFVKRKLPMKSSIVIFLSFIVLVGGMEYAYIQYKSAPIEEAFILLENNEEVLNELLTLEDWTLESVTTTSNYRGALGNFGPMTNWGRELIMGGKMNIKLVLANDQDAKYFLQLSVLGNTLESVKIVNESNTFERMLK